MKRSPHRREKVADSPLNHCENLLRFSFAQSLNENDRCAVRRVVGCILHHCFSIHGTAVAETQRSGCTSRC
nr:MAG TPA: hypothetical protein [Caudoviricetes sp.]